MEQLIRKAKKELGEPKGIYSIAILDIDFFIRYRMKFSNWQCRRIYESIKNYICSEFTKERVFYRGNSDEFIVFFAGKNNLEAATRISSFLKRFRKQRFASSLGRDYRTLRITFSAGIARSDGNCGIEMVFRKAVTALFLAKAKRRNTVAVYETDARGGSNRILFDRSLSIQTVLGAWGKVGSAVGTAVGTDCRLWEPQAIAADKYGNIYIADQNNHQILCYDGKSVKTVAGCGFFGYTGDGGDAREATLNKPTGLCVAGGNLYITDTGNDAVRRVDLRTHIITTICGDGSAGYAGDGSKAVSARLNKPGGIAADRRNNIYINDIANNVIRKIDPAGYISTFAGSGMFGFQGDGGPAVKACFNEIYNICIDREGENLYLADYANHRIRKVDLHTNVVSTVAGNGTAGYEGDGGSPLQASLNRPAAVWADSEVIYIAESGNHSVRVITRKADQIFTLAGGAAAGSPDDIEIDKCRLANPNGLSVYRNILYILDGANNRVCAVNLEGCCHG